MPRIQVDLSEEENVTVELFKIANNLKRKSDAIKRMVSFFGKSPKPIRVFEGFK